MNQLGYMYIAKRPCGRVSAAAWDDPGEEASTAKSVAEWIKRGLAVERIKRRAGDPQPEWICNGCRGKPCAAPPAGEGSK